MAGITPLPESYYLNALNSVSPLSKGAQLTPLEEDGAKGFAGYLKDAVDNIEHLGAIKDENAYNLAIGEIDDIAALAIDSEKHTIAVQLLVQMRNRLMDSYSEIMRMNM